MRRRSWLSFILLLLCLSFNAVSGARHRKHHHSSAIVVGTVYCDTCVRQQPSKSTHFISGATVVVECGGDGMKSFREEVKTNEKGEFEAKLPVSVGKNVDRIKSCSVKLVSSSQPYCAVAATATSSGIRFKSKKAGTHVLSAGFFTFKPELCSQKDFAGKRFPIPPVTRQKMTSESDDDLSDEKVLGLPIAPVPGLPIAPVPGLPIAPVPGLPIPPIAGLPIPPVPAIGIPPVPAIGIPPVPGIGIPPASNRPHLRKTTP